MKILVGSKNESKINGIRNAFKVYYDDVDVIGIDVSSDVSKQPKNDEIYKGARNRVENLIRYAKDNEIDVDYFVSIEAGLVSLFGKWYNMAFCYMVNKDGIISTGISNCFEIPSKYVEDVISTDLGKVTKKVFGIDDKEGTINILTDGVIPRSNLNMDATIMALIKYRKEKW